jgi:hypothetical protein
MVRLYSPNTPKIEVLIASGKEGYFEAIKTPKLLESKHHAAD